MKICRACKQEKDPSLFVKNKAFSTGVDTICLECSRQRVKEWRKDNPEKRKEQLKRETKKDYNHNKHLKATYGITRKEYLEMFIKQGGCCKICGTHQLELTKRLAVDHCHSTNKIRGLLCQPCNLMLGGSKDNIDTLKNAITYLEDSYDDATTIRIT